MAPTSPPYSTRAVIGISIAIAGNILINVALNIQRLAHKRLSRLRRSDSNEYQELIPTVSRASSVKHSSDVSYLNDSLWWLGIALMTTGEVGNFMAYGLAPASVVSPLGVFALLSNCIVAPIFFHEKLHMRTLYGVFLAVVGILFIILSAQTGGQSAEPVDPVQFIFEVLAQTSFRIYITVSLLLIVLLFFYILRTTHVRPDQSYLFSNILLVALFGGYTALSTKFLSGLITAGVWRAVKQPISYILGIVLALTAALQVVYLNKALRHFDASVVIPVHFVFFTISVVIGSAITFKDFEQKTFWEIVAFFIGCLLTFAGVWIIGGPNSSASPSQSSANISSNIPSAYTDATSASQSTNINQVPSLLFNNGYVPIPVTGSSEDRDQRSSLSPGPVASSAYQKANMFLRATSNTLFPSPGTSLIVETLPSRQPRVWDSAEATESGSLTDDEPIASDEPIVFDGSTAGVSGFLVGTMLQTRRSLSALREAHRNSESHNYDHDYDHDHDNDSGRN